MANTWSGDNEAGLLKVAEAISKQADKSPSGILAAMKQAHLVFPSLQAVDVPRAIEEKTGTVLPAAEKPTEDECWAILMNLYVDWLGYRDIYDSWEQMTMDGILPNTISELGGHPDERRGFEE